MQKKNCFGFVVVVISLLTLKNGSKSMVPQLPALISISPGNLEMQILKSQRSSQTYRIRNSGNETCNLCFNKPSKCFWFILKFNNRSSHISPIPLLEDTAGRSVSFPYHSISLLFSGIKTSHRV